MGALVFLYKSAFGKVSGENLESGITRFSRSSAIA
jgi:hypothetical protein